MIRRAASPVSRAFLSRSMFSSSGMPAWWSRHESPMTARPSMLDGQMFGGPRMSSWAVDLETDGTVREA